MSNSSRRNKPARRAAEPQRRTRKSSGSARPGPQKPRRSGTVPVLPVLVACLGLLAVLVVSGRYAQARNAIPEPKAPDHLVLNEVCGYGQSQLTAPDGNCYGWAELYNPTKKTVSLTGWSLSNRKFNLYRYRFPENTAVEPGERLLVYFVGSVREDYQTALEESGVLFTDYLLGRGDTLCLSQGGRVVDTMDLPAALPLDTAYGRTEDGGVELSLLSPTPDASNNESESRALVEQPVFSAPSGFYDEDFSLTITAPEGCTVYYTLDSTRPTAQSERYTDPIQVTDATEQPNHYALDPDGGFYRATPLYEGQEPVFEGKYYCSYLLPTENLDKCTVVRAVAVDEAGNVSEVTTASYFVGYENRSGYQDVSVLSLVSDPDGLFGDNGIMDVGSVYRQRLKDGTITTTTYWGSLRSFSNFFCKGAAWERSVHLDFFDADRNLSFSQEGGIRCHGNASRKRQPKSFSLYARSRYDGNKLFQGPFFSDGLLTDKVFLVNGAAMRRYLLVNRMDGRTMDTQDYRLVQLFLDGEYWGFYAIQEPYNSGTYLEDHYGLSDNDAILLKANSVELLNLTGSQEEVETEYNPMMDFVQSHDMTKEENWTELTSMMDVQSFVDFYAANLYLCNMDFNWHHNIYLFKSRKVNAKNPYADGRWHWMLYDVDYSTGDNPRVLVDRNMFEGNFLNSKHSLSKDPMFSYLAKNKHFRQMFVNTFMDLANDVYGAEEMADILKAFEERWNDTVFEHVLRYPLADDKDTLDAEKRRSRFNANCTALSDFFQKRFSYAVPGMAKYFDLNGEQVTLTLQNSEGGTVRLNTLSPKLEFGDWSGIYYTDVPVTLSAEAKEGWVFDHWEVSGATPADSSAADTELTLEKDATVSAVFVPEKVQP